MGVDERQIRFALELVRTLGLLAGAQGRISTNPGSRVAGGEPAARFADLAAAWWGLPVTPTLTHDPDGKAIPVVGGRTADGSAKTLRCSVITTVAETARRRRLDQPGLAGRTNELATARRDQSGGSSHRRGLGRGASAGRAGTGCVDPHRRSPAPDRPSRPDVGGHASTFRRRRRSAKFGSDLTVLVAGSPAAAVAGLLDSCADRESRGAAVIWRFSPASVRRAFDEGTAATELVGALQAIAETELPQPLTLPDRRCRTAARFAGRPAGAEPGPIHRRGVAGRSCRRPCTAVPPTVAGGTDGGRVPVGTWRRAAGAPGRRLPAGACR